MATPYDNAGGLLGMDPETIRQLLLQMKPLMEQFQPSEADRRAANTQALITGGLSLLGTRKGQEWDRLGYAGMNALDAQSSALQNAYKQRQEGMQSAGSAIDLMTKVQGMSDAAKERKLLQQMYSQGGMPGVGAQPSSPASIDAAGGGPPLSLMPAPAPMAPDLPPPGSLPRWAGAGQVTPKQLAWMTASDGPNIAGLTVPPPNAPAPSIPAPPAAPTKQSKFEQYSAMADTFMKNGLPVQAQKYADIAEKFRPQLESQKTYMVNGQRTVFNVYKDGTMQIAQAGVGPDAEKVHFADAGNVIIPSDQFTGAQIGAPIQKSVTPDAEQSNKLAREHLEETIRHNQMVEGDPATVEATAQGIASGNLAPLSGFALGRPMGQAVMARVMQINPEYSAKDFGTGQKAEKDFSTGKQGNIVRSFNVALTHLDTLGQLSEALHNGNTQLVNKIGNIVSQQTGSPAVTNFNTAKAIVANEIIKAIIGSGGGVEDRDKAQKLVSDANSPAQLKGVIDTYKTLMGGQLQGLRLQYETATKRKDFDRFLTPQAKAYVYGGTTGGGASDVRSQADAILSGGR